jgi:hypothetical protein
VWRALLEHDLAASAPAKLLLALRGYGLRARRGNAGGTIADRLQRFGFTKLNEVSGDELVFGLAGRFWRFDGGLERLAGAEDFRAFAEEGCVKTAWNLRVDATGPAKSLLTTETRVKCFGPSARRKFRLYWALIAPFSGVIRMGLLRGVKRRAERGRERT